MSIIKPTIGRKVWFFETPGWAEQDATIIDVHGDRMVSLYVINRGGTAYTKHSVTLVQEGDDLPVGQHCTWMPFQMGQASKSNVAISKPCAEGNVTTEQSIGQMIEAKGLTAPRITPDDIAENIENEYYFTAREGVFGAHPGFHPLLTNTHESIDLLTFCVLVLRNGFTVTGESACASPENFDAEIGRKIARANAVQKMWPLMGYELRTKLSAS